MTQDVKPVATVDPDISISEKIPDFSFNFPDECEFICVCSSSRWIRDLGRSGLDQLKAEETLLFHTAFLVQKRPFSTAGTLSQKTYQGLSICHTGPGQRGILCQSHCRVSQERGSSQFQILFKLWSSVSFRSVHFCGQCEHLSQT